MTSATQRLERSKQLKAQREYNFLYKNYLNEQKQEEKRIKLAEEITKQKQEEVENAGVLERFGYTVLDTITELGGGLLKLGEGLVDAGAGIAGGIGWLFGADTQWAEDFIKYDWTQENYYGAFEDELTSKSYWNDATIVKDVIRGVGQALPTIALVAAAPFTGGATLAGVPFTIGATIASAGGTGMEEALNDGAEFGEAFAYGLMQSGIEGAVELATAGMGKGITSIGKSVGKNIGKSVTKSVGKTMVEEAMSEGVEEGLSALLNPLTKTTYKGAEALEVYKDMSFYLDAGQQALVGAVVGGISAGSGGIVNQKYYGGKTNYNIVQSAQEIATLDTKENNLWKNGKLDAKALQEIQNQRQIELENISSQLMAMSESDRVNALEKLKSKHIDISGLFNEDGSINYENTQNWAILENDTQVLENIQNNKRKPLATDNIEAYSPRLKNKIVEFAPTSNPISENIKTAKSTIMAINPDALVVIAEELPVGNAFYDPNSKILYLSNKADSIELGGHEITHSLEGTKEYAALKDYVLSNVEDLDARRTKLIERYKEVNKEAKQGENGEAIAVYEAETEIVAEEMGKLLSDQASIDRIVNQNKSVAARIIQWIKDAIAKLTKRGIKGEYYNYLRTAEKLYAKAIKTSFGGVSLAEGAYLDAYYELNKKAGYFLEKSKLKNADNLDNLVELRYSKSNRKTKYIPYSEIGEDIVSFVKKQLNNLYEGLDEGVADGFAIEKGNAVYLVDSGKDNGEISFGFRSIKYIDSAELRAEYVRRKNNESISKGYFSDGLSSRVGNEYVNDRNSNRQQTFGTELSIDNQQPSNHKSRVFGDDADRGRNRLKQQDKRYTLKDNQGNTLSPEQAEYFKDSKVRGYDGNLEDIRFSLQEKELTKGQVKKEQAKGYKTKVYDKQEADRIVNNLLEMIQNDSYYAEIKGKTKAELVDYLWIQLNTKDEGYRAEVALKVADYLIDNAVMQDYYQDYANQDNIHTLDVLRDYLHKVDLSAIKGEIKHKFDKDNSPYLIWGARKGTNGLPSDVVAQELAEEGINISATNEADIFFEIHDLYKHALSEMKNNSKITSVKDVLGKSEVEKLRQEIAREVLISYDKYGKKTKFAEYIEKSQKRLKTLRTKFAEYKAFEQAQKGLKATLNSLKNKFEDKASWKVSKDVKALIGELVKIESYYGNVTKTARDNLRQVGKQLEAMYGDTESKDLIPFYDVIRELTDPSKDNTRFTTEEIIDIANVLKSFKHTLENYNLVSFNGEKVEIDKIATQGIKELTQAKDLLKGLDINPLHRLRNSVYANPVDRMAEFGLYRENSVFMQIYRDMLNGDSKRAKFVMEANMLFNDFYKRNKNYNNVLQEQMVINNGYEDITLHKRQALSLYLTSLRPQGRSHIFGVDGYEGIVKLLDNKLSTRGEMKKALDKGVEIKVTEEMLVNIEKQFTQADREYIELVRTFFNENSRKAKQEVDMALYGVSNVEDGDYFPLKVSKDKIYQEIIDNNIFQVVLNFGFNKTVKPNSSNMIVIDGVDNILAEHIRNMSLYAGYALPLNAYNKIMNRQIMNENGTTSNIYSAVGKIDSRFQSYMKKLWLDIQGISTSYSWLSGFMNKIRWATANSALGLNPKVLLTQTLSLAAAQSEFNPKYIVKGLKNFFGEKEKLDMAKYAPLMWERNLVGNSLDVQDIRQVGKEIGNKIPKSFAKITKGLNTLTSAPISWMDSNVIQSLWFAAQYEVAETKGLEFGTEANKVEAGKRLTEVVFKTQQTPDPLGRSRWMRSDNELIKFGRMFTGDMIQLTGRLIASINKYHLARQMIKSGDVELVQQGQEVLSSAKTGLAKAGSAFILNQVMLLAIAMAFKWLKGKDDDEEWSEVAKNEAMANLVGLLPFGGDLADLMLGYEPTNMAYTALTNTFNIITETGEIIGTFIDGGYKDEIKLRASIRKSILNGSRLFGMPAQNLESYTMGVIGKISPATKEEYEALFKTKSTQAYLDKVEKALANRDEEYADRIINIMFDSRTGKIKDDKVIEVTRDLIEQGYDVLPRVVNKSITYEGVEYTLTDKQHKQFTKIYSQANESVKKMVNLKAFAKIDDEAKAKAMTFIYNYYYNLAIEDMLGEDLESKTILFAEAIPIEQLAMAISQAQIYTADTDKKGAAISGSRKAKIQSYINSLGLTAVQKYMIMGYLGYTNKYGEAQVRYYINRLKLTKNQKEKLFEMSGY